MFYITLSTESLKEPLHANIFSDQIMWILKLHQKTLKVGLSVAAGVNETGLLQQVCWNTEGKQLIFVFLILINVTVVPCLELFEL